MDNEEIIELFFSKYNEQAFNEKILEDIDYEIPHDLLLNYVRSIIQVPFNDFVSYVVEHADDEFDAIEIEDIPVFYSLVDCREGMIDLMLMVDNKGLKLMEIGSYIKTHSISKNPGYTVIGKKSVQVAETLGIVYEYYNHWYLNCVAYVFEELSEKELQAFYARAILRNSFVKMLLVLCCQGRVSIYDFLFDPYQEVNISTLRSIEFWHSTLHRAICKPYHLHEIEEIEELCEREVKKAMGAARSDLWSRKTDFDISTYIDEVCVAEVDLNDPLAYEPKDSMGKPMVLVEMPDGRWAKSYAHSAYSGDVPSMVDTGGYYRMGPLPDFTREIAILLRDSDSMSGKKNKARLDSLVESQMRALSERRKREYEGLDDGDAPMDPTILHSSQDSFTEKSRSAKDEITEAEEVEKRKLEEEKRRKLIAAKKLLEEKQRRAREARRKITFDIANHREQQRVRELERQELLRTLKKERNDRETRNLKKVEITQDKQEEHRIAPDNTHQPECCQEKINPSPSNIHLQDEFQKHLRLSFDYSIIKKTICILRDDNLSASLRGLSESVICNIFDVDDFALMDDLKRKYMDSRDFKILDTNSRASTRSAFQLYRKFLQSLVQKEPDFVRKRREAQEQRDDEVLAVLTGQTKDVISEDSTEYAKLSQILPCSLHQSDIDKWNNVFKHTTTSYKFFWILALMECLKKQPSIKLYSLKYITSQMIAQAWPIVKGLRLSLGKTDKLSSYIKNINSVLGLPSTSSSATVYSRVYVCSDATVKNAQRQLGSIVPYRFLAPWIAYTSDKQVISDSQNPKHRAPYSLENNKNELYVRVSKEWKEFFSVNENVLRQFVYDELARYLHVSNSDRSRDEILEMLSGILSQG